MTDATKRCPACGAAKPLAEFYRLARSKDGRQGYCKACANAKRADWGRRNPEKNRKYKGKNTPRQRRSRRFARYGITEGDYLTMLAAQGGACASCGIALHGPLHIDHDHSCCPTEKQSCGSCVRGLLCPKCNLALGLLDDSADKIRALLEYIQQTRTA